MSTYDNQTGRLPPQARLQQHYIIVGQAGKGGMGAVYQAIDTRGMNGRRVAIKEMSQGHLNDEELREASAQFQHEATMLSRLSHPNLPRIYNAFNENGRSYLVMDFIEGKTLFQLLKESGNRPLPVMQVLDYARQLCDVLAYLHQQRPAIIFRDLKPTNVMVTSNGHVYLIDFGIARFFKEGQAQDTMFLGSPGYAAPEQHGSAQTNPRSDLYSLGATLHFCLTGRDPYHAKDRFTFPPVRQYNPQVPIELDQLIQRLLALNEQQRPESAIEVQQVLTKMRQQAADNTGAISPTPPPLGTASAQPAAPTPGLAATQYVQPQFSNQGPLVLPPTAAIPPSSAPPVYSGRSLVTPPTAAGGAPIFSRIWTPTFIALVAVMLVVTVGGSLYTFNVITASDHLTEFGLSVLALLVAVFEGLRVQGFILKSLLFLAGLAALLASVAFGLQVLQFSQFVDPNLIFTAGLAIAAIISLFWFTRPFAMADRLILGAIFGVAAICALLQYPFSDLDVPKHILLLVALIMFILGTLVAAQMERVQSGQ